MKADEIQVGGTHYTDMALQPWEVMQAVLSREEFVGFLKGNIIKYGMRQGAKPGSPDADKARHYQAKLAEVLGECMASRKDSRPGAAIAVDDEELQPRLVRGL